MFKCKELEQNYEDIILNDTALFLPEGYEYSDLKKLHDDCYEFKCNLNENEIKQWVHQFGNKHYVEWRIARTYPNLKGTRCLFRIDYRCQHSSATYKQKTSNRGIKSTNCPAELIVKRCRKFPTTVVTTVIKVTNTHNHVKGISATSLKYRDVSEKTKDNLKKLYFDGHSPSTAHHILHSDAFVEFGEDYYRIAADRNRIPDVTYCYNLFYKEFKKGCGSFVDEAADYSILKKKLDEWCAESGASAFLELIGSDIIIAILTPLMKRVHSHVVHSGEVLYLNANGQCNRSNPRIYLLYTPCIAGGLPLGCIITSSNKQEIFERALEQFCNLDKDCETFFGRGSSLGPQNIIIDNDLSERNSLITIWPKSNLFLCSTHVLRAVWRWLLDTKHNIQKSDQFKLLIAFNNIITANSIEASVKCYEELNNTSVLYPQFCIYIAKVWWPDRKSWCMCHRSHLLLGSSHSYNYAEYAVRAIKDIILKQTKAYNIMQLLNLIITRFDKYYCQRIIDFVNGRFSFAQLRNFIPDCKDITEDRIVCLENNCFLIENEETYFVDINLGVCTCLCGISGVLCKHQCAVILYKQNGVADTPTICNVNNRKTFFYIATSKEAPKEWLKDIGHLSNNAQMIQNSNQIFSTKVKAVEITQLQSSDKIKIDSISSKVLTETINHDQNEIYNKTKAVFDDILCRWRNNQSFDMAVALEKFCKNYTTFCKSDCALQSALNMFGERRSLRKSVCTPKIAVQPSSVSRRKIQLQVKRRRSIGRPRKFLIRDTLKHDA